MTTRASNIEACAKMADASGRDVIRHMVRMAEFYRRRANEQLRAARAVQDQVAMVDARSKLEYLRWVDGWISAPARGAWKVEDPIATRMNNDLAMIGHSLQRLLKPYADHPGFLKEWLPRAF